MEELKFLHVVLFAVTLSLWPLAGVASRVNRQAYYEATRLCPLPTHRQHTQLPLAKTKSLIKSPTVKVKSSVCIVYRASLKSLSTFWPLQSFQIKISILT